MKKIKYLLLIIMAILVLPFTVLADDEEEATPQEEPSREVTVYFFRGEGCSHCAEAEEWFKTVEEEMGDKYVIKDYETWQDEENAELMNKVAKARGEEEIATGVPYIIIGDKSWVGFTEEYKEQIKNKINEVYEQEIADRYDIMSLLASIKDEDKKDEKSNDILSLVVILLVVGGSACGIYFARKQNA